MEDKYEHSVLDCIATLMAQVNGTMESMGVSEYRALLDWASRRLQHWDPSIDDDFLQPENAIKEALSEALLINYKKFPKFAPT